MTTVASGFSRVEQSAAVTDLRQRHAAFYAQLAAQAAQAVDTDDEPQWSGVLEAEIDNIRAALTWATQVGDTDLATGLAGNSLVVWQNGRYTEGRSWLGRALALPRGTDTEARLAAACADAELSPLFADREVSALTTEISRLTDPISPAAHARALRIAARAYPRDDPERGRLVERALDVARTGAAAESVHVLLELSAIAEVARDLPRAFALIDEAIAVARPISRQLLKRALGHAPVRHLFGDTAAAISMLEELIDLEGRDDDQRRATRLLELADVLQDDEPERAEVLRAEAFAIDDGSDLFVTIARGGSCLLAGDLETARRCFAAVVDAVGVPDPTQAQSIQLLVALERLAKIADRSGDYPTAVRLLEERQRSVADPQQWLASLFAADIGTLSIRWDDTTRACRSFTDAARLAEAGDGEREYYEGRAARAAGDLARAADLLNAAVDANRSSSETTPTGFLQELADVLLEQGDGEAAVRHALAGHEGVTGTLIEHALPRTWELVARGRLVMGDVDGAIEAVRRLLELRRDRRDLSLRPPLLEVAGRVAVASGRHERGALLLELAAHERKRLGPRLPRWDREELEAWRARAREELGADPYDGAVRTASELDAEHVLDEELARLGGEPGSRDRQTP